MYSEDPRYKVKEIVCIEDKYYRDRTYESIGDRIDRIQINTLQAIADLVIPMNQGKYEGGNDLVSSVQINKYSYPNWDISGKLLEKAQIDIDILLIDGRTINIRFTGTTAFGGSEWE